MFRTIICGTILAVCLGFDCAPAAAGKRLSCAPRVNRICGNWFKESSQLICRPCVPVTRCCPPRVSVPYSDKEPTSGEGVVPQPQAELCPTTKIAQIPLGIPGTGVPTFTCVWELSNCKKNPVTYAGMIYANCDGTDCDCVGGACRASSPPSLDLGNGTMLVDEAFAFANDRSPDYSFVELQQPQEDERNHPKIVRSNKKVFPFEIPSYKTMIPNAVGEIMTGWGVKLWRVKYVKALEVRGDGSSQYFALYKIFRDNGRSDAGERDVPGDLYIGIRTSDLSGVKELPGGLDLIEVTSAKVRKLDANCNCIVREIAVQVPVKKLISGDEKEETRLKWFHLYGSEYKP